MYHHNPAKSASPAQRKLLRDLGVSIPADLNSYTADKLIKANFKQWAAMPPTARQERLLRSRGKWADGITRGRAAEMIGDIKGRDWPLGPGEPG